MRIKKLYVGRFPDIFSGNRAFPEKQKIAFLHTFFGRTPRISKKTENRPKTYIFCTEIGVFRFSGNRPKTHIF